MEAHWDPLAAPAPILHPLSPQDHCVVGLCSRCLQAGTPVLLGSPQCTCSRVPRAAPSQGAGCKGCLCLALGEEPRVGARPGQDPATRLGARKLEKRGLALGGLARTLPHFTGGYSCSRQNTAPLSPKRPELSCRNCLYVLEINPLPAVSFALIFSRPQRCLFTLLIVSFCCAKV